MSDDQMSLAQLLAQGALDEVDFSKVPQQHIPDGDYEAQIKGITLGVSQKNQLKIDVDLVILSEEYPGFRMWDTLSLAPQALFSAHNFFTTLQVPLEQFDLEVDEETGVISNPNVVGDIVTVKLYTDTYQDVKRSKVKRYTGLISKADGSMNLAAEAAAGAGVQPYEQPTIAGQNANDFT